MAWATLRLSLLLAALILAKPLAQAQDPVAGGQAGVLALSFRDPLLFLLVSSSECGLAVAFRPEGGGWVLALIDPLAGEPRWYLEVPGSVSDLLALDQRIYVALGGEPGILSLDCEAESVYMLRVDPGIPGYANARLAWAGDRLVVAYFSHNYTRIVLLLLDPERVELLASHSLRLQIPGGVGGVSDVWLASGGGLIAVAANYNVYAYEGRITGGVSVIGVNGSSLSLLASYFVEDFKIMGSGIVEGTVYVAGYFRENRGSIGDSAILWVGESGRGGLIVGGERAILCLGVLSGGTIVSAQSRTLIALAPGEMRAAFYEVDASIRGSPASVSRCYPAGGLAALGLIIPGSGPRPTVLALIPPSSTGSAAGSSFALAVEALDAGARTEPLGPEVLRELGRRGLLKAELLAHESPVSVAASPAALRPQPGGPDMLAVESIPLEAPVNATIASPTMGAATTLPANESGGLTVFPEEPGGVTPSPSFIASAALALALVVLLAVALKRRRPPR